MNVDSVKIESEEDGFWLVLQLDEEIPLVTNEGALRLHIHACAIELLREVEREIGPWMREGEAVRHAFLCNPDESLGLRVADDIGYALTDPKHPDFHSVHADLWDSREGK